MLYELGHSTCGQPDSLPTGAGQNHRTAGAGEGVGNYKGFQGGEFKETKPLLFDPLFVGPAGTGNADAYRLKPESPCFKKGIVIRGRQTMDYQKKPIPIDDNGGRDYFGNPVPANAPPTIGAFQLNQ